MRVQVLVFLETKLCEKRAVVVLFFFRLNFGSNPRFLYKLRIRLKVLIPGAKACHISNLSSENGELLFRRSNIGKTGQKSEEFVVRDTVVSGVPKVLGI